MEFKNSMNSARIAAGDSTSGRNITCTSLCYLSAIPVSGFILGVSVGVGLYALVDRIKQRKPKPYPKPRDESSNRLKSSPFASSSSSASTPLAPLDDHKRVCLCVSGSIAAVKVWHFHFFHSCNLQNLFVRTEEIPY